MNEDRWWAESAPIGSIDCAEHGITSVAARQREDGQWEYAVVFWRHHCPSLVGILRDGEWEGSD